VFKNFHSDESKLTIKPIEQVVKRLPSSSYEAIYEMVSIDDIEDPCTLSPADIISSLGDKYQTETVVPDFASSFNDIFQQSTENLEDRSQLAAYSGPPLLRWSAPVGAVEPPILEADEFAMRFGLVQEKTDSHWEDIEKMMVSTESLTNQDIASHQKTA